MRLYLFLSAIIFFVSCGGSANVSNTSSVNNANKNTSVTLAPGYDYEIVNTYPHDPKAFTQGLDFLEGFLYEGTGGKEGDDFYSSLRKVEITTGKVLQKYDLPRQFFGEGITILGDKIYQVTWREQTGFVYDLKDFKLLREFRYLGEGWGLANDGTNLIMSDGTHVIRYLDPETARITRTLVVLDERGKPVMKLNELEYVNDEIWANVWESGWILRIDPNSGKIVGRIDLNSLADRVMDADGKADVLNGIAYDETGQRIFITGKKWKQLFEIKITPKQS